MLRTFKIIIAVLVLSAVIIAAFAACSKRDKVLKNGGFIIDYDGELPTAVEAEIVEMTKEAETVTDVKKMDLTPEEKVQKSYLDAIQYQGADFSSHIVEGISWSEIPIAVDNEGEMTDWFIQFVDEPNDVDMYDYGILYMSVSELADHISILDDGLVSNSFAGKHMLSKSGTTTIRKQLISDGPIFMVHAEDREFPVNMIIVYS